jgi:hypothetical protein
MSQTDLFPAVDPCPGIVRAPVSLGVAKANEGALVDRRSSSMSDNAGDSAHTENLAEHHSGRLGRTLADSVCGELLLSYGLTRWVDAFSSGEDLIK